MHAHLQGALRLGQLLSRLGKHDAAEAVLKAAQRERSMQGASVASDIWASVATLLKQAEAGTRRGSPTDHFLVLGVPRTACTDELVSQLLVQEGREAPQGGWGAAEWGGNACACTCACACLHQGMALYPRVGTASQDGAFGVMAGLHDRRGSTADAP